MMESFYIANKFKEFNEKEFKDDDYPMKVYIINTKWFEQWKKYTNYDYYISNIDVYHKLLNRISMDDTSSDDELIFFNNNLSYEGNIK